MSNRWFTLRQLIVSNKHLRIIRNDFKDHYNSSKYQIRHVKDKLINYPDLRNSKEPEILLTQDEISGKYEYIKNKNLSLIDLHPFADNAPLVSIIILNKNGFIQLKRLFKDFEETIQYPSYEIILVDNASTDNSISFLKELSNNLPLTIVQNTKNKSFSEANNQAAEIAQGEFLLLLNNNVEPTYGWLNEMMQFILKSEDTGAVGAKLIYPDCSKSLYNKHNSFKTQHEGIFFKEEIDGFIKPYNISCNEPFKDSDKHSQLKAAVSASTLLVKKDKYWQVGGLDAGYNYLYDVDLCLKLIKKGYINSYCPTALLFHYEFGTLETDKKREIRKIRSKNQELFQKKWNHWLRKQLLKDKIYNKRVFSKDPLKVVFVVSESGEDASAGDYFTASELGESLKKFGWNISFLLRAGSHDWYDVNENVDILISLLDVYDPRKIRCSNKSLIKIAWPRNWFERWVYNPGLSKYDLIFASSETACNYIEEKTGLKTFLLSIATNPTRFNNDIPQHDKYLSDYCFTGSYWNDPRDIIEMLDPDTIPHKFKLYGKNWKEFTKFNKYYQGFINYSDLPLVYASTKIVIDDVNRGAKNFGSINSRVFDALATGALVITNGAIGAEETFKGKLPVWKSQEDLNNLIEYYLTNEDARIAKVKELQEIISKNHTYENRAYNLKKCLEQEYVFKNKNCN